MPRGKRSRHERRECPAVDVCWSVRQRPVAAGTASFQWPQALDDAIAYRRARVVAPCPDCDSGLVVTRCDDHACDMMLIAAYHRVAQAAVRRSRARDSEPVGLVRRP
jgi:hypothetical protein